MRIFPGHLATRCFVLHRSKEREGLGLRSPSIVLLKPPVRGLLLKGPRPHDVGKRAELRDDEGLAKAVAGRGQECSELSSPSLQAIRDPRTVVGCGVWRRVESRECSQKVGEAGHPGSSLGKGSLCLQGHNEQLVPGSSPGCLDFLSPWSLDPLTFPVSEEAVYSQKVIHSLIRSTSLLMRIPASCPGGGKGSSPPSPTHSHRGRVCGDPLS